MPPHAGVYDITLSITGARGNNQRHTAAAYWPGRKSRRWVLLDVRADSAEVVAWRPRPPPYTGPILRGPLGIIMPQELGG